MRSLRAKHNMSSHVSSFSAGGRGSHLAWELVLKILDWILAMSQRIRSAEVPLRPNVKAWPVEPVSLYSPRI